MEHIKPLIAYTFKHKETNALLALQYGRLLDDMGEPLREDSAQRWRFLGTKIPMPVRNGSWFEGFTISVMEAWLNEAGYEREASVCLATGTVRIARHNVDAVIAELIDHCDLSSAIAAYMIAHNCDRNTAREAVHAIQASKWHD